MATQKMGQLYCGQGFGTKWNRGWKKVWNQVVGLSGDVPLNVVPQELFDSTLAWAFWAVVDQYFDGHLPAKIADSCTVPERAEWSTLLVGWSALRS